MTGHFYLDWAILAVSLFNMMVMLWLALTVILNAERRSWGIWLAAVGLSLGSIFFICHSAILGHGITLITPGLDFWWRLGWIPGSLLPYAWYVVMLWYSGFWDHRQNLETGKAGLYQRQRIWLIFVSILVLLVIGLILFANPISSFSQLVLDNLAATPSVAGIPILILVYPAYAILCMGLSLDALQRPGSSSRLMGDRARDRSRRWLMATSLLLLMVSLLVGWVMLWVVESVHGGILTPQMVTKVGWYDLVIESLIAISVLLLGQAVVAYEVFTGKTLPRQGLAQYWRRGVILALGYSLLVSWSLSVQLRPIYSLLLSAVLIIIFYALLGWRSYAERERFMRYLHPFVASQELFKNILESADTLANLEVRDNNEPFHALCANVLEARRACLVALGPLAPLSGPPLVYPENIRLSSPPVGQVTTRLMLKRELCINLDSSYEDMIFAVPLWSERGLTGVLFLGEKEDGGLYAQEEIEIAQATGERLIDARASAEIARSLIALQRQRLVQSQVLDHRARRVLHDELLPLVHTVMLNLSTASLDPAKDDSETIALLAEIHRRLSDLLHTMPDRTASDVGRLGFLGALRQTLQGEMRGLFDEVAWQIQPGIEEELQRIPSIESEVLFFAAREAMRNAAQHGRGANGDLSLHLSITIKVQDSLVITIEDNGVGFRMGDPTSPGKRKLHRESGIPESLDHGQKATDWGNGQGLALHSTMMAVIGGTLTVDSMPEEYTRITIELPKITLQG
jgi:signal transduction histidine kinase